MKWLIHLIPGLIIFSTLLLNSCGDDTAATDNNTVPYPPTLVSPPNGEVDSTLSPIFTWNSSSGADFYKIQIADDTNFIGIVYEDTTGSTSYVYNGTLLTGYTYYWRVNGINTNGEGDYSAFWSFRTPVIINGSIAGAWVLIYSAGTMDICPGEMVTFPSSTGGIATLMCPGGSPVAKQYNVSNSILTYTASGIKYHISFTQNDELVLTGINNNRILYYALNVILRKPETGNDNSENLKSVNSSE